MLTMQNYMVNSRPAFKRAVEVVRIAFFVALLIVFSKISINLPFSPVPFTFQVLGVFLAGLFLKPYQSLSVLGIYILTGALGLPVFARGGGPGYLFGMTGGFIFGFLFAAVLISFLKDRLHSAAGTLAALLLGLAVIYLTGTLYMAFFTGKGFGAVLSLAVVPFIPLDLVKVIIALLIYRAYESAAKPL